MTWFKVDDTFAMHPKVAAAGPALALWVRAGSWSAQQLTEGFVPSHMVPALGRSADAKRLVSVGLWEVAEGGYRFHDWLAYQPSRAKVIDDREAAAERKRLSRERAIAARMSRESHTVTPRDGHGVTKASVTPPPTRPDPTRPERELEEPPQASPGAPRPTTRGSRIPDDFEPSEAMLEWARREAPNAGRRDHDAFVDFWRAKPGAAGVKLDWPATWRNWMRKASDERPTGGRRSTTDERVAQARSLRDMAEQLDAADQHQIATVTQLAIGDAS